MTIIDGEQTVASGRIDITARDKGGSTVLIELKAGPADRDAIGQILSYMGDLTDGTTRVRGTVVAREFSSRAVAAARAAPNVRLVRYGFRFLFETLSTASVEGRSDCAFLALIGRARQQCVAEVQSPRSNCFSRTGQESQKHD